MVCYADDLAVPLTGMSRRGVETKPNNISLSLASWYSDNKLSTKSQNM